jgi:hypothetical protein
MHGINTAYTGCPGPQLWITTGWYRCTINSPNRYLSEMDWLTNHPQLGLPGTAIHIPPRVACLRRNHYESSVQRPITWRVFHAHHEAL